MRKHVFQFLLCVLAALCAVTADAEGIRTQAKPSGLGPEQIAVDVEAGPIWDNDHAKQRCPEVLEGFLKSNPGCQAEWTGHWVTTVWGEMSVCNFLIKKPMPPQGVTINVEAGPIWDNDHAKQRCPEVLEGFLESSPGSHAEWTGHWVTTVWGKMSVCNFLIRNR